MGPRRALVSEGRRRPRPRPAVRPGAVVPPSSADARVDRAGAAPFRQDVRRAISGPDLADGPGPWLAGGGVARVGGTAGSQPEAGGGAAVRKWIPLRVAERRLRAIW